MGVAKAVAESCGPRNTEEIVVCGSREKSQRYRLPKLPDGYETSRGVVAGGTVGGLPVRAHVDPVELPGGAKSNRIMITVGTSF